MPDDDRFQGIGEQLEGDDEELEEEPDDADRVDEADDVEEEAAEEPETASESAPSSEGGPAFSFDEATQQTVYPRPETWRELRAALSTADAELLTEHGIDDVEGRELHDAALAIAAERPGEVAERVAENRGE